MLLGAGLVSRKESPDFTEPTTQTVAFCRSLNGPGLDESSFCFTFSLRSAHPQLYTLSASALSAWGWQCGCVFFRVPQHGVGSGLGVRAGVLQMRIPGREGDAVGSQSRENLSFPVPMSCLLCPGYSVCERTIVCLGLAYQY